ncbi:fimbria/pilus outer membrane usher protein [Bdellovibrionota bacterium FG-2]
MNRVLFFPLLFSTLLWARGPQIQPIPVLIDRLNAGDVECVLPEGTKLKVRWSGLEPLLSEKIESLVLQRLGERARRNSTPGFLDEEAFSESGLVVRFDSSRVELAIEIPAFLRKSQVHSFLYAEDERVYRNPIYPSAFSSYVNVFANEDITWNQPYGVNGRQPVNLQFETAANAKSWVLEGQAGYTESRESITSPSWQRGDVRVVRDLPAQQVRFAGGDLNFPVTGYQRFRPMAGLMATRNFDLRPTQLSFPVAEREIFLKVRSTVRVYVNGNLVRTLDLDAGKHKLTDLPLGGGVSVVRLEIDDILGRHETMLLDYAWESELLRPGISQFTYALGVPSASEGPHYRYSRDAFTVSASHRVGITDRLTLGVNGQGDHHQSVFGLGVSWATAIGTWNLDPAYSLRFGGFQGSAARLRYTLTDYKGYNASPRSLSVGAERVGVNFLPLGMSTPLNPVSETLSALYSQQLWKICGASVGFDYSWARKELGYLANPRSVNLTLNRTLFSSLQASVTFNAKRMETAQNEQSVFLLLSQAFPGTDQYVNASVDTQSKSSHIDWTTGSPSEPGRANFGARIDDTAGQKTLEARTDYTANRMQLGATQTATRAPTGGTTTYRTALRAQTALVLAGGHLAWSRVVRDSFVLVTPNERLSNEVIALNPTSESHYRARADGLGAGVISDLASYRPSELQLDPSLVTPGLSLGEERFTLLPTYKSGAYLKVGTDADLILSGTLQTEEGASLALVSGEINCLSDSKWKSVTFFTTRQGRFRLEGFKAGVYVIRLFDEKWESKTFEIPSHKAGIFEVGKLQMRSIK